MNFLAVPRRFVPFSPDGSHGRRLCFSAARRLCFSAARRVCFSPNRSHVNPMKTVEKSAAVCCWTERQMDWTTRGTDEFILVPTMTSLLLLRRPN